MRRRFLFNKDVEKSLVITANEPSTVMFDVFALGTCECNLNNTGWVKYTPTLHSLNAGETISFRGDLIISTAALDQGVGRFSIDGNVDLYGSPIYLLAEQFLEKGAFESLFAYCGIRNVSSTFLPSTTLATYCYSGMFRGCTSLITAPELPATTLADYCYQSMFNGCTSLTTAPELPATTLASICYGNMFRGCTSLVNAPELPATTLADRCYWNMFYDCTSLTTAPELPATTLTDNCYIRMFYNCTKLNYIKMLATDISASSCLSSWAYGVASTGTFVKNPAMTSLPTGVSGIPSGWTVVNDGGALYLTLNTTNADNIKAYQIMETQKVLAPNGTDYDWTPSTTNIYVSGEAGRSTFTNAPTNFASKYPFLDYWDVYFENMDEIGVIPICRLHPDGLLEAYDED